MDNIKNRSLAIHQPNFLPWMGYFFKIQQANSFVFLDHVPFSKGSYTNRVQIHGNNKKPTWITVPLQKHALGTPINEIIIDHSQDFESKILAKIHQVYRKEEHFSEAYEWMKKGFEDLHNIDILSTYNIAWIDKIAEKLSITIDATLSSELDLVPSDQQVVLDICEIKKIDRYISGMGGKNYMNEGAFNAKSISIDFVDFTSSHHISEAIRSSGLIGKSAISWLFCRNAPLS